MTQVFSPPLEVGIHLGPEGAPSLVQGPINGRLEPVMRWIAELDWWRKPIAREYWKVLVNATREPAISNEKLDGEQLLCELFHDLYLDCWFLERIWD